jgi:segregation and condensation protein A
MEDRILELLTKDDNVTWHSILYDLVKADNMNPWDIDVSLITKKYIETIKKLQEMNFRVSGKVVLAAAMLVKIKSSILIGKDIAELDSIFASAAPEGDSEMGADDFYSGLEQEYGGAAGEESPSLFPRTPQPRKRKVSMYDLINALQKALEVKERRIFRLPTSDMQAPEKKVDITAIIANLYSRIASMLSKFNKQKVTFSELVPSKEKKDKINNFIPLLHLATQQKIMLHQEKQFSDIDISIYSAAASKALDEQIAKKEAEQKKNEQKPSRAKRKAKEAPNAAA